MSLISRLKAVVAGDEYLDDDFVDYQSEDELSDIDDFKQIKEIQMPLQIQIHLIS